MIESVLKLVGRRRTFDTEAEQAAYVQGYNDACDSAAGVAYGLALVCEAAARAALVALANTFETTAKLKVPR